MLDGIRYSHDYGSNWTVSDASSSNQWTGLSGDNTGQYWIATCDDGIHRSSDYGASWSQVYSQSGGMIRSCSSDSTGQYLAAADRDSGNVLCSSDHGNTWTTPYTVSNLYQVASDYSGQYVTLACNDGHILQSDDYGDSYREVSSGSQQWTVLCQPPDSK